MAHKAILISLERQRAADCVDADDGFIWADANLRGGNWRFEDFLDRDRARRKVSFFFLFAVAA